MSKQSGKNPIENMIYSTWLFFFFGMSWICVGIICYGVVFQWIFRLLAPNHTSMHLPVFITLWSVVSGVYYFFRKQKP
jgi:hypothetical protein